MVQPRKMQAPGNRETKFMPSAQKTTCTFDIRWSLGIKNGLICPRVRNFDGSIPLLHEQLFSDPKESEFFFYAKQLSFQEKLRK